MGPSSSRIFDAFDNLSAPYDRHVYHRGPAPSQWSTHPNNVNGPYASPLVSRIDIPPPGYARNNGYDEHHESYGTRRPDGREVLPRQHGGPYDHQVHYYEAHGHDTMESSQWSTRTVTIDDAFNGYGVVRAPPRSGNALHPQKLATSPYGVSSTGPPSYNSIYAAGRGYEGVENLGNLPAASEFRADGHYDTASELKSILLDAFEG